MEDNIIEKEQKQNTTEDVLSVIRETYENKIKELESKHNKEVEDLNKRYEEQEQRHIRQIKEILMTGRTTEVETSQPVDETEQVINKLAEKYKRRY